MDALQLLYAAVSANIGYRVKSDNPAGLRNKLYAARKQEQKNGNNDFDELSFFEMPDGETIFIVRHAALRQWRGEEDVRE